MKTFKSSFYFVLILLCFTYCKNSNESSSNEPLGGSATEAIESGSQNTTEETDPLTVPTPTGYYQPKGVKKLNLIEMYEMGSNPNFKKDFPLSDKEGKPVPWTIMEDPANPMFMQMYVDENDKIVEGVVFEITEEVKAMILKVRMVKNN